MYFSAVNFLERYARPANNTIRKIQNINGYGMRYVVVVVVIGVIYCDGRVYAVLCRILYYIIITVFNILLLLLYIRARVAGIVHILYV